MKKSIFLLPLVIFLFSTLQAQEFKTAVGARLGYPLSASLKHFITENHLACTEWLDKIINDTKSLHRLDVQRVVRLFYIVSQIELEIDYQIIDNFCRATHRFLKVSGLTDKVHSEYIILSFLRKYISVPSAEVRYTLEEFKNALDQVKNNPREAISLGLDEFLLWIRSKLEKKPILQLIEETN